VATFRINIIVAVVAYAFALAGSGFFPALVMGIFWKRANKQGAIAGMVVGFLTALILIVVGRNWGIYILGVKEIGAGVFGVPIGFLVIWAVSLMYPPPDQQTQDLVEEVRYPRGTTMKRGYRVSRFLSEHDGRRRGSSPGGASSCRRSWTSPSRS
jgi:cation/acetate symporter